MIIYYVIIGSDVILIYNVIMHYFVIIDITMNYYVIMVYLLLIDDLSRHDRL